MSKRLPPATPQVGHLRGSWGIPKGAFNGTARITFYGRFIQGFESSTYTLVGGSKNPPPQIPGKG